MTALVQDPTPSNVSPNWSRTGCITCKRRRKKCDRTQPTCTNCEKRGIQCEGYQQLFIVHPLGKRNRNNGGKKARSAVRSPSVSSSGSSPCTIRSEPLLKDSASESRHRHRRETTVPPEFTWIHLVPNSPSLENDDYPSEDGPDQIITEPDAAVAAASSPSTEAAARPSSSSDETIQSLPDPAPPQTYTLDDAFDLDTLQDDATGLELCLPSMDMDEHFLADVTADAITDALAAPRALSAFPNFSGQDFYYLQYLDEQAAKQLLNLDLGAFNPLRRLILPRAVDCAGVLNSICAVAACHQAQRSDPDTCIDQSVIATRFYLKSVNWLRSSFGRRSDRSALWPTSMDDASIITSLLLCKYEIIKGSATHWRDHLDGLERLLQMRGGIGSLESECGQYVASFLRYHRMVADICRCENSTPSQADNDLDVMASSALSLDAYSGCAHHLLRACHDIARLVGRLEAQEIMSYADLSEQSAHIIASLGTSVIEPSIEDCSTGITVPQISRLLYVAQRIRYAAFVFLHSIVERAIKICRFGDTESDALRRQIPYTKAQALDGCLEMLAKIPIGKHCEFAGLALALFLAGCEVEEEHRKYLIMEKLFIIERSFGLGHIARARDALMMIWQRETEVKQNVWWNKIREMGWELILC